MRESREEEKKSSVSQEAETRPAVSAWTRLGLSVSSEVGQAARCNGKLQRTKRIEPEPEPGDDKDSIASVTIISVPSGIVTPVTTEAERSGLVRIEASTSSQEVPAQASLMKQSSLPPPASALIHKHHLGKRAQSPNSGWL